MTEGELLYAILWAIYLTECALWARRGTVALRSAFGGRPRPVFPGAVAGNRRGGLVLLNPIPLGPVYLCRLPRVSVSAEGMLPFVTTSPDPGPRAAPAGGFRAFSEMETISGVDDRVEVNDEPVVWAAKGEGREIAAFLGELADMEPGERSAGIGRRVAESTDVEAIRERAKECERATANLGLTASLLFVGLFVVIPLVAYRYGVESTWLQLLLGLYAAMATNHLLFWRAHRRLYPADFGGRLKSLLLMIAAPPAAIRAADAVTLPLLEGRHPLAAAAALSADAPFREFAAALLRDAAHPRADYLAAVPAEGVETEREYRMRLLDALSEVVRERGLDPAELIAPAPPRDPEAVVCCPRCGAEFLREDVTCEDCGGLGLVPVGAAAAAPVDSGGHDGP